MEAKGSTANISCSCISYLDMADTELVVHYHNLHIYYTIGYRSVQDIAGVRSTLNQ
jgi:hypothetical protein